MWISQTIVKMFIHGMYIEFDHHDVERESKLAIIAVFGKLDTYCTIPQ